MLGGPQSLGQDPEEASWQRTREVYRDQIPEQDTGKADWELRDCHCFRQFISPNNESVDSVEI